MASCYIRGRDNNHKFIDYDISQAHYLRFTYYLFLCYNWFLQINFLKILN
jgi:hypothetical protein